MKGAEDTNFLVDPSYLNGNRFDSGVIVLCFQLFDEIKRAFPQTSMKNSGNGNRMMNFDGSMNMNNNPHDSF